MLNSWSMRKAGVAGNDSGHGCADCTAAYRDRGEGLERRATSQGGARWNIKFPLQAMIDVAAADACALNARLRECGLLGGGGIRSAEEGRPRFGGRSKSPNVFRARLLFDLSFRHRFSGKLKDSHRLALLKAGQKNHLTIRKLERIMVRMRYVLIDLTKDRRRVTECPLLRPQ